MEESTLDEETRIKLMVEAWKSFLLRNLQCRDLLYHTKSFLGGKKKQIRQLERGGQSEDAASMFLQCLEESEQPGAYAAFRDALHEEDFDHIAEVINGEPVAEFHEERCKLINEVFAGRIADKIDPILVLRDLKKYGLLTKTDEEYIRNIHTNHSAMEANSVLLDCVFRKKRNWYNILMTVLCELYPDLADDVDPDFKEKKDKQRQFETYDSVENDAGTMEAAMVTVVGGAYKPGDNLSDNTEPALEKGSDKLMEKEKDNTKEDNKTKQTVRKQLNFDNFSNIEIPDCPQEGAQGGSETLVGAINNLSLSNARPKLGTVSSISEIKEILTTDQTGNRNIPVPAGATAEKTFSQSKSLDTEILYQREENEDDATPVKELVLRPYQEELAKSALQGENAIICAPTGSGKTYVATRIMQNHLKLSGVRKIVFFANQVALVHQQIKVIKEYMPREYRIRELSSDTEEALKVPLRELLLRNDILVMTPQIMVDALRKKEIESLSEFTLLVFDECHHANSKHPFNRIMFSYMDLKLKQSEEDEEETQKLLPQIVGLTASVGVGKAKDIAGAVEHIRRLCANLDAYSGVSTVRECEEDLAKHARTVGMDVKKTDRRRMDIFQSIVSGNLMSTIEKMMVERVSTVTDRPRFSECLKPPVERGGDPYTQWISKLKREVANIEDQNVRRFFFSCRKMLEMYNKSLAINEDCRTKDAVIYLEKQLNILYTADVTMDDTDIQLKHQLDNIKQRLREASDNPLCVNPKLTALRDMIEAAFRNTKESRCMVFVKTRDLAMALKQWMIEDQSLQHLKPGTFTGQSATADRGGMTRNQQLDAAQLFRQGDHKVIIATSVAEEGMDFSQCNLVIRYEYVTNEIAMVQAKGRARAKDSQFVVVTGNQRGTAEKEELNLIREMIMNQAIARLQTENLKNMAKFVEDIVQLQKVAKAERDSEALNMQERTFSEDDFEIRCGKCNILACFSSDIRRLNETNHIILDHEFGSKIRVTPHPRPCNIGFEMKKRSKIGCKKCGQDWGIGVIYRNWNFALIKIESFITIDFAGRRDSPRKWKNAPFLPPEITDDELASYRSLDLSE